MQDKFTKHLEEAASGVDAKFTKLMNKAADELNKPKYGLKFRTFETGPVGGRHIKLSAYMGNVEVGSLWVRDHGGTIGKDFSDPQGVFEIDAYYDIARKFIAKGK